MTFSDYQQQSRTTAKYPTLSHPVVYPVIGLSGEVGEISEKVKKVMRDKEGVFSPEDLELIKKELGDVLWYLAQIASELGLDFNEVAQHNIEKLASRAERNVLQGSGDTR